MTRIGDYRLACERPARILGARWMMLRAILWTVAIVAMGAAAFGGRLEGR